MNKTERRKSIDLMHKSYSHQIAELYEKDLLGAENVVDRTIAFLMALENVKISTIESLSAANVHLKLTKMLDQYSKSKQASIEANRSLIEKQVKSGNISKIREKWNRLEEKNSMYR